MTWLNTSINPDHTNRLSPTSTCSLVDSNTNSNLLLAEPAPLGRTRETYQYQYSQMIESTHAKRHLRYACGSNEPFMEPNPTDLTHAETFEW